MTALDSQPSQRNFLSPLGYKLVMKRAPNVQWFIQAINIPGLSAAVTEEPTPIQRIPFSGDHLEYEELRMVFKVGEDLADYMEIHNWLKSISDQNPSGYLGLKAQPIYTGAGLKSDIVLMILNSSKNPIFEATFRDAFPIALSSLEFNSTDASVDYLTATATFQFTNFDIIPV